MSNETSLKPKGARMTQAERTAVSDRKMFDAAIALINEHGIQKTTLKDIGERAGYSRGLANYRFGSKDGLMLELFEIFDESWKAHLHSYVGEAVGLEAVTQAANALRDFLKKESNYMRAMYLLWYECVGHDSDMRFTLASHHDVYRNDAQRWLEQGIERGKINATIEPKQFALQYCAFIFGIVYQWLVNPAALDLDEAFSGYIATATTLLKKPDETEERYQ